MAALPPRIPPSSVELHHGKSPSLGSLTMGRCGGGTSEKGSWVDDFKDFKDFKDFSWARRGSRRRSMSDSVAFFESGVGEEEEYVMVEHSSSSVSNISESKGVKIEQEEVESSSCLPENKTDDPPLLSPSSTSLDSVTETIVDPKRVKRILANRQSAQRSRVRKLQYISELERSVTSLQTEVSVLSPRVAFLDQQRSLLNVDNTALKQRIAVLIQDNIFNDGELLLFFFISGPRVDPQSWFDLINMCMYKAAHEEALRREIERLQQVYSNQNMKKMAPSKEEKS